jgi:peptidoglycan/LPS O-acetylase OafA/YrhL
MRDGDRYIGLDGLRGVAAIMVVLFHARLFATHGYLAVDLFFIMSGLVIARAFEQRLAEGQMRFRDFTAQRLVRLYPMLFLGGLVGLGFALSGLAPYRADDPADLTLAIVSQFTLIPLLSASSMMFPLNNPQWSIVWELAVNLAFAAGLCRLRSGAIVLIAALAAMVLVWFAVSSETLAVGVDRGGVLAGLARASFGFFAGVLLHRTRGRWEERVPRLHFAVPALIFVLLAAMPPTMVPNGPLFGAYDLGVVIFLLAPIAMLAARSRGGAVAAALGQASYPLYAVSEPVIFWLVYFTAAGQGVVIGAVIVLVLLSWALGRWVDAPLNAWRRSVMGRSAAAPVTGRGAPA